MIGIRAAQWRYNLLYQRDDCYWLQLGAAYRPVRVDELCHQLAVIEEMLQRQRLSWGGICDTTSGIVAWPCFTSRLLAYSA